MTTKLRRARSVLATALVLVAGVILAMRTADAAARTTVVAYFDNSNGVFAGDDVLIRGVPVGKIVKIEPQPLRAKISFWFDRKYRVPADAAAAILSPQLVTGRAIQLTPPYAGGPTMADGTVIPQERTVVPVEWDDLRAQLQRLTVAINPAVAISGIELINQWYYNPAFFAIMSDCANTQIGVWSENSPDRRPSCETCAERYSPDQLSRPVGGAVVHRRVKAPLVGEKRALLGAAGDPYDACAVGLGQLAGNRADRTGWCPARCVRLGVREGESGGFDRP